MNETLRVQGHILKSNLVFPKEGILYPKPTYTCEVELEPDSVQYLEQKVLDKKHNIELEDSCLKLRYYGEDYNHDYGKKILKGNKAFFSTLREPKLEFEVNSDAELIYELVQLVCKFVVFDAGDFVLAPYIVEPYMCNLPDSTAEPIDTKDYDPSSPEWF